MAQIPHNRKRETLGLPHTLSKEWLLDIAFAKRETFAYACETYSRIVEQAQGTAGRRAILTQYARSANPTMILRISAELLNILTEAVEARNGWKRILARCSSSNRPIPPKTGACVCLRIKTLLRAIPGKHSELDQISRSGKQSGNTILPEGHGSSSRQDRQVQMAKISNSPCTGLK